MNLPRLGYCYITFETIRRHPFLANSRNRSLQSAIADPEGGLHAQVPKAPTATDSLRSGTPIPIQVQEDGEQRPVAVTLEGSLLEVVSIEERWEDIEDWWKDNPVVKMHYQVTLGDGRQLTLFRNMKTGNWYQASCGIRE